MKKKLLLLGVILGLMLVLTACGGGDSATTEETKDPATMTDEEYNQAAVDSLNDSIKYYKDVVLEEIPKLANDLKGDTKNTEKLNAIETKLQEALDRLYADERKYLLYKADDRLSENTQQAGDMLDDGFFEVREKALKPILAVFKGESNDVPDYSTIVLDVEEKYIDPAKDLL